jgi:hypothetical protein
VATDEPWVAFSLPAVPGLAMAPRFPGVAPPSQPRGSVAAAGLAAARWLPRSAAAPQTASCRFTPAPRRMKTPMPVRVGTLDPAP